MGRKIRQAYGALPLPYLSYLPEKAAANGGILVYLHGSGERGIAPEELDATWGLPRLMSAGMNLKMPVVCPVCPIGEHWRPELIRVFLLGLRSVSRAFQRLTLCGYSMGATGVYAYLSEHESDAAAAIVVAGRIGSFRPERIARVPLLAIYGDADERYSGSRVAERLAEVRAAGGNVDLRVIPGAGHDVSEEAFNLPGTVSWIESYA